MAPVRLGDTMPSTETANRTGAEPKRRRALTVSGLLRSVLRRPWVQALAAVGLLALTVWMDAHFGSLTGVRMLYILPIWLGTRLGGARIGLLGALLVSAIVWGVDSTVFGMGLDAALPNFLARFLALVVVTLIIAYVEKRLSEARRMATRDPLTGVMNRTEMQTTVEQAITRARFGGPAIALALVDCDRFKQVNDKHGHAFGDRALRALAKALQAAVKDHGTVGRMGGDEFAVFFEGVPEAAAWAQMVRAEKRFTRHMKRLGCHATISFGLVPCGLTPTTFPQLLEAADSRMYARKRRTVLALVQQGGPSDQEAAPLASAFRGQRSSRSSRVQES